jgi:protoporphyrinogen/coproporphyrinogen III oxidase
MSPNTRIAVVGGGVSGLAAAYQLWSSGHDVELIEREPALGGRCAPGLLGERQVSYGGKNIGRKYELFRAFTSSLGHHPYEPFGINSSRVEDGRLLTIDSSRRSATLRTFMKSGSAHDLARIVHLTMQVRRNSENRYLGGPYFTALSDRRDRLPLATYFGPRLTKTFLRALTVRMNGAEPDEVFLGTFGTNLGMLDTFDQLSSGIQPVLQAFTERVPVRVGARVQGLEVRHGTVTGIRLDGQAGEQKYDGVVLSVPAYEAANLLAPHHSTLAERLRQVRYFPAAVVLAQYDSPVFRPEVRALVFGEGPCSNAGTYGINDLDIVRYTFSGSEARQLLTSEPDAEDLLSIGEQQLSRHMPVDAAKRIQSGSRRWHGALCAYLPFHGTFLEDMRHGLRQLGRLELAGDYMRGVSIEACFRAGTEAAERLASQVTVTPTPSR